MTQLLEPALVSRLDWRWWGELVLLWPERGLRIKAAPVEYSGNPGDEQPYEQAPSKDPKVELPVRCVDSGRVRSELDGDAVMRELT